ncbi:MULTISPECIES: serine O-acetyltransferase [unclassified Luteococcus]|uniref:serine O-acetyltransferase n=1 Tax=unclassified Luteococcus TaxID=2639923 RepID=UPI00313AE28D
MNINRDQQHAEQPDSERTPAQKWWVERLARRYPIVDVIREDRQINAGLLRPGTQTLVFHRLANWRRESNASRMAAPAGVIGRAGLWFCRNFYGIEVSPETTIGRRVRLSHQHGIVIHKQAVIADEVLIRQGVTIGLRGDVEGDQADHVPHILKGAQLGAGAVVVGPVTVGEDSVVGANAVVTHDVPAGGRALAPKTQILPAQQSTQPRVA